MADSFIAVPPDVDEPIALKRFLQRLTDEINAGGGGTGVSLPGQAGHAGQYLTTNGISTSWANVITHQNYWTSLAGGLYNNTGESIEIRARALDGESVLYFGDGNAVDGYIKYDNLLDRMDIGSGNVSAIFIDGEQHVGINHPFPEYHLHMTVNNDDDQHMFVTSRVCALDPPHPHIVLENVNRTNLVWSQIIGGYAFDALNSINQETEYCEFQGLMLDETAGSETGGFLIKTKYNGSDVFIINAQDTSFEIVSHNANRLISWTDPNLIRIANNGIYVNSKQHIGINQESHDWWYDPLKVLQIGDRLAVWLTTNGSGEFSNNAVDDGDDFTRMTAGYATRLELQATGHFRWMTAGTDSAGSLIDWDVRMFLTNTGNLAIGGNISPEALVHIHAGDPGVAPDAKGNTLLVESDTDVGLSLLCPGNPYEASLLFGDTTDNVSARLRWTPSSNWFYMGSAAPGSATKITSGSGGVAIGINSALEVAIGDGAAYTIRADLHVRSGDSTLNNNLTAGFNEFLVESANDAGMTIMNPNTGIGGIAFGDPDNRSIGRIEYDHTVDEYDFVTGTHNRVEIGGGSADEAILRILGDTLIIEQDKTPADSTATGTKGQVAWDANYFYQCIATDSWKRLALINAWTEIVATVQALTLTEYPATVT